MLQGMDSVAGAAGMDESEDRVAILDVGKTNIKIVVATADGTPVEILSFPNSALVTGQYLAIDLPRIQEIVLEALTQLGLRHAIRAIVATAHGCGGVLVDEAGPVLPAMDYEAQAPDWLADAYSATAPSYFEVFCSISSGAIRPAQQMLWQSIAFPKEFSRAKYFLMTQQYLAYWLGGRPATEISSLAAQCHLWNPLKGEFPPIVARQGWLNLFPPFAKAGEVLGAIAPWIAKRTGLDPSVEILAGAHDSNANLYRYKAAGMASHTVLSTGTWMIGFNRGRPLEDFDEARAMVANVDVDGEPVASTLTMTGREYAILAGNPAISDERALALVPEMIKRGTLPIPSFVEDDGAFPKSGSKGRIMGPLPTAHAERGAIAALYAAFTADLCLDALGSATPIVIDGGFATNLAFGRLVAALRPNQPVSMSRSKDGTALGAGLLWRRFQRREPIRSVIVDPVSANHMPHLRETFLRWRALADKVGASGKAIG